jgi:hypothetical protein
VLAIMAAVMAAASLVGIGQANAASSSVFLNAQYADKAERPEAFGPDKGPGPYIEARTYVRSVHWTSWGGSTATGAGEVMLLNNTSATSPVSITFGGLTTCGGQMIYTTYTLTLAAGAATPKYWAQGQHGMFPCHITAGYFNPNDHGEHAAAARGDCTFNGLVKLGTYSEPAPWMPETPRGAHYFGLCRMAWASWGGPTASVTAIMRNGFTQWAATAKLSGLAWCPDQALAYTALTMTLYGTGEKIPSRMGSVTKREAERLLHNIHRPGVSRHVYKQTVAGCEAVG